MTGERGRERHDRAEEDDKAEMRERGQGEGTGDRRREKGNEKRVEKQRKGTERA